MPSEKLTFKEALKEKHNRLDKKAFYIDQIYDNAVEKVASQNALKVYTPQREKVVELGQEAMRVLSERDPNFREKINSFASRSKDKIAGKAKGAASHIKQDIDRRKRLTKNLGVLFDVYNTSENYKPAKKLALIGAGAAGATAATAAAYKKSQASRDKDTKTKMIRDSVAPDVVRQLKRLPDEALFAIATAPLAPMAGTSAIKGVKKLTGNQNQANAAGLIATIAAGAIPGVMYSGARQYGQNVKAYDKMSNKYLGRGITDKEKKEIKQSVIYERTGQHMKSSSPEEMMQGKRKALEEAKKKREGEKRSSKILNSSRLTINI